jgi:hypothetical protein
MHSLDNNNKVFNPTLSSRSKAEHLECFSNNGLHTEKAIHFALSVEIQDYNNVRAIWGNMSSTI